MKTRIIKSETIKTGALKTGTIKTKTINRKTIKTIKTRIASSIIFALFVILTVVQPVCAADAEPSMEVEVKRAAPGQTVTLNVDLKNNPGFCAAKLKVNYDDALLELQTIELGDKFDSGDPEINSPVVAVYYTFNKRSDDTLLKLNFKVKEGAAEKLAEVSVSYDEGDICNRKEEDVNFISVAGGVNITNGFTTDMSVSIKNYGISLSLSEYTYFNQYMYIDYNNNVTRDYIEKNGGVMVFKGEVSQADATYQAALDKGYVKQGLIYVTLEGDHHKFVQQSLGVIPKDYGQTYTFVAYVKLDDGSYVYSTPYYFSVDKYCDTIIGEEDTTELHKALVDVCKEMKSLGAKAEGYFKLKSQTK